MGESAWEAENGRFDLDWLQPVLDGAHQRGISVVLGTPTYAVPPWQYPEIAGEPATGRRLGWARARRWTSPIRLSLPRGAGDSQDRRKVAPVIDAGRSGGHRTATHSRRQAGPLSSSAGRRTSCASSPARASRSGSSTSDSWKAGRARHRKLPRPDIRSRARALRSSPLRSLAHNHHTASRIGPDHLGGRGARPPSCGSTEPVARTSGRQRLATPPSIRHHDHRNLA
ncbi:beta-galactosidase [Lentzea sp. JNUCC 0626]|uniref:beta-galactosidase n=1 Tax=Lentzea sp. JNUCC 0626 TaxID=3367513 RepID=UPI003748D562